MNLVEHTDALAGPANKTVNFRIIPFGPLCPTVTGHATIPHCLGRFRVLDEIARGGMGVVLRAYDAELDRELAIKLLSPDIEPDSEAGRRFAQEARVASQLNHPSIMPVYEAGTLADGRAYFVMPFVQGGTLAVLLAERPDSQHEMRRWLEVFERICIAVGHAHAKGIIHRDLKPANVIVEPSGHALVMDWGVASVRGSTPVGETSGYWVFGTPSYMPPEQARGSQAADPRGDVFGLGAILCEILTGHPPYLGSDAASVTRQAASGDQSELVRRIAESGADWELIDLTRRCLAVDIDARPGEAGVVAGLINDYLVSVPQPTAQSSRDQTWARRAAAILATALALS